MKRLILFLVTIVMLVSSAFRQDKSQPDLNKTLAFMRAKLDPSKSLVDDACTITFGGEVQRMILLDGWTSQKGPTFAVVQEILPSKILLGNLDPASIKAGKGMTRDYLDRIHDWSQFDINDEDLTYVTFNDGPHKQFGVLVFRNQDNAERFVTAMRHAVTLCTESDFAPTPTRRAK